MYIWTSEKLLKSRFSVLMTTFSGRIWSHNKIYTCEVLVFCHVSLDTDPVEYCLVSIHGNLTYFKPFCALDTCNASCGKKKDLIIHILFITASLNNCGILSACIIHVYILKIQHIVCQDRVVTRFYVEICCLFSLL